MKFNLIHVVKNIKSLAKSLFLIVALCGVNCVNARQVGTTGQQPQRQQQQPSGISRQPASPKKPKMDTSRFTPLGKYIVKKIYDEGKAWNDSWDEQIDDLPNGPEKDFLKDLGYRKTKKIKRSKESSSIEEYLRKADIRAEQQQRTIDTLLRQLAQAKSSAWDRAYEYAVGWSKSLGLASLGSAGVWALGFSAAPIAAVGIAGIAAHRSFKALSEELKSGRLSKAVGGITGEVLIAQLTNDSGRCPTYKSKAEGINDIQDTENLGSDFESYCKNVLDDIIKEQESMYKNVPEVEAMDKKIDNEILLVRGKYFDEDSKQYMKKIEAGENIVHARAVVSEYLRAGFRLQQQEILEQNKEEEKRKVELERSQPKKSSWWDYLSGIRMGG